MLMNKVILIDAKNMCYRAHFSHLNLSSKGQSTSVIYGFLSILLSIKNKYPYPMIIVWDGRGETWRHKLTKNRKVHYKGNRKFDATRKLVNHQADIIKEFLKSIGYITFEVAGLEADDLIGILARHLTKSFNKEVIIHSGD